MTDTPVLNALTIDVEDYYQVSAFEPAIRFEDWPTYESRVERAGFGYDSSIFPILHDCYGIPGAGRLPHRLERAKGSIVEFLLSTVRVLGVNFPVAGGRTCASFPCVSSRPASGGSIASSTSRPSCTCTPWEIDPGQPPLKASGKSRIRHNSNLKGMEGKVRRLLEEFSFGPARNALRAYGAL